VSVLVEKLKRSASVLVENVENWKRPVLNLPERGVLPCRTEEVFSGRRPRKPEKALRYWLSIGRQVQMRPVLASITDQLVAGTGPTVVIGQFDVTCIDFRNIHVKSVPLLDDTRVVIRMMVVKQTLKFVRNGSTGD
jgi:hypothetical protein